MELSPLAVTELRLALSASFGDAFLERVSDNEVDEIGCTTLTLFSEALKHKAELARSALLPVAGDSAESAMTLVPCEALIS